MRRRSIDEDEPDAKSQLPSISAAYSHVLPVYDLTHMIRSLVMVVRDNALLGTTTISTCVEHATRKDRALERGVSYSLQECYAI